MSARTIFSISGTQTSAPVARATGATAPMWSKCVCVSRIPSSLTPSCSIAFSRTGASSPGSTSSARSDPSTRKRKLFSATGPTVNMRTSIRARSLAPGDRSLLPAPVVERAIGDVAERDVQDEHDQRDRDGRRDVLLEDDRDQDAEERGGDACALRCTLPGRRPVHALLPLALRLEPHLFLRARLPLAGGGARGSAAVVRRPLDDPGRVAAVLAF